MNMSRPHRPHRGWRRLAAATASAVALGGAWSLALAQEAPPRQEARRIPARERFTAFAADIGTLPTSHGARSGTVDIVVERWSTDAERRKLVEAFEKKGADGLLSALHSMPRLGTLRRPNTRGWELHYAVQVPAEDGGRRILLGTDRHINAWEEGYQPGTSDYLFTLIELHLDKDGQGDGRLSLATKIVPSEDGKQLELESYSSEPVHFTRVVQEKN